VTVRGRSSICSDVVPAVLSKRFRTVHMPSDSALSYDKIAGACTTMHAHPERRPCHVQSHAHTIVSSERSTCGRCKTSALVRQEGMKQCDAAWPRAGSTQQHWPFPADNIMEGYAYILTHPGLPCILWEHAFDWGLMDQLKALVELRRSSGITRLSDVMILAAEEDMCALLRAADAMYYW
jgi:hypothetical protein